VFPFQNGLKHADALSPFIFSFALEYATRQVQENQGGLEMSGTHQLLVYAEHITILGKNINTFSKNKQCQEASRGEK
jgi:hypothetical protein